MSEAATATPPQGRRWGSVPAGLKAETPEFKAAYRAADADLRLRHAKAGCVLALILMPAGMSLDWFVYPQLFLTILAGRLASDLLILPIFLLLFTQWGRSQVRWLGSLWALVPALAISWMIWLSEGAVSPYYAGLNLVIITCTLMPYDLWDGLVICCGTIALYTAAILLHTGHPIEASIVFNNYYFLVLTAIIATTACHFFHLKRVEDFRLRHQLDAKNREIAASYDKLQELDRLRSHFFANISHELRTPLTLIVAPLEDLLRRPGGLPEALAGPVGVARENGLRLLKLINDLLEIVRLDEKAVVLRRERLDLCRFAAGVADSMRYLAEAKGLSLERQEPGPPVPVDADPSRLEKVLVNLITNAVKFTPAGGRIAVACSAEGGQARVAVSDTGIGIGEADLGRLFERFRQVDGSSTRRYQGAGLGLALARELMHEHGGEITVASRPGQGSVFTVAMPLAAAGPVTEQPMGAGDRLEEIYRSAERRGGLVLDEGTPPEDLAPGGGGTQRILVVDDEPDMRRYVVSRLVDQYQVVQSGHGERALEQLRRHRPVAVVLDLMLPGINGIEVCRRLRADPDPAVARCKVLLLTARMDEASKIEALEAGADDFLTKPFSTIEVRTRVAGLVRTALLQRELEERAESLTRALERLKKAEADLVQSEKMSALGTLSAGVLHEVNNPLNFSLQAVQVARRVAESDPRLADILEDVRQGLERIRGIVSDLGMFAYRSDGSGKERFPLETALDPALRLVGHELKHLRIERDLAPGATVEGSPTQICQVLVNLLANAGKALIGISGREPLVRITSRREGGRLVVSVRDNGCGIPREALPQIFDPFFTTRQVGQGTGLGLSICHTIIANHGGTIRAASEPDAWTDISFDLPLTQDQRP